MDIVNQRRFTAGLDELRRSFLAATPFNHVVIDDFFSEEIASRLASEVESATASWYLYKNPIEIKKACNNWNEFPKYTYLAFSYLV